MATLSIPLPEVSPQEEAEFIQVLCPPNEPGFTPDRVEPDRIFRVVRVFQNLAIPLPFNTRHTGRDRLVMWVIEHEGQAVTFPSPPLRAVEGEIVHTITTASGGPHTIHHHGIDPTPANDGVGANTFEISGRYDYQWLASTPGTYIYHCHKNTVLHFERGMWGALIIDPRRPAGATNVPPPPYPPGGPGLVRGFSPGTNHLIRYDKEAALVTSEHDSRWHELGHGAAEAGCSVEGPFTRLGERDNILHDFQPDVFMLTGAVWPADNAALTGPPVIAPTISVGETLLIRLICAGYNVHRFTLGLDAQVIAMDGRPLGVPPWESYSSPFTIPAGRPFMLTSAMRWDLIVRPSTPGPFEFKADYLHWITKRRLFTGKSIITVT